MDNYTKNNNERQNELFCPVKKLKKIKVERLYSPKEIVEKIIEEYESGVDEVGTFSTHTSTTGGMVEPISGPYVPTIHDAVNGFVTKVAPADCNWLSDFLVEEDWQQGQVVLIDATCSAGKNTFVESLAQKNKFKNILILANRTANREQINDRLGTEGNYVFSHIEVKSYQALEHDYKADSNSLEKYDLIVADEAHYFVADACHNSRTNRSLELIMSTEYPVKIFMSATITELEAYILSLIRNRSKGHFLGNKLVKYVMKRSKQYIEYASCMDREQLIQQTKKSDEKWFIFVDSFQKGYKYLELLGEDAVFINSENKSGNTEAAIQLREIIEDEQFSCKYLIATACLDNGINVKDRTVKNIILDTNNKIQMIQMLGRKRCIDETDTFKLFIPYESFKEVRRLLSINLDNYDKWCNQQCALEYYHFPFLDYSMNNPEGEEQRNMLYMDEKQRKFMFNELGFYNI